MSLTYYFLFLLVIIVVYICLQNAKMKKSEKGCTMSDVEQVKKAAKCSLLAANTVSPLLALIDVLKAETYLTLLVEKHGSVNISKFPVDVVDFLDFVRQQKELIIRDVMDKCNEVVPDGYFDTFVAPAF